MTDYRAQYQTGKRATEIDLALTECSEEAKYEIEFFIEAFAEAFNCSKEVARKYGKEILHRYLFDDEMFELLLNRWELSHEG